MELLIFDLDGTLADTSPTIARIFNFALEVNGENPVALEDIYKMIGVPLEGMFERVLSDKNKLNACCDVYRQKYITVCTEAELFPGVKEGLALLPQRKAIATSKQKQIYASMVLDKCGIMDYFETVVVAGDVEKPKPAPDMLDLVLKRTRVDANDAIMIGDTPQDIIAGKAAGTATIGVVWGAATQKELKEANADYIALEFSDIARIVDEI